MNDSEIRELGRQTIEWLANLSDAYGCDLLLDTQPSDIGYANIRDFSEGDGQLSEHVIEETIRWLDYIRLEISPILMDDQLPNDFGGRVALGDLLEAVRAGAK